MPLETIGVEVLRQTLAGQAPQSQSARWMDSLPSPSAHLVSCSHAIPEPRRTRHCRLKAVEPLRQSPQMAFWSSQISAVILAPFVQTCEAFLAPWCPYTRSWKLSFASQLFLCCLDRIPRTLEDICEISMSRSNLQEGTHVRRDEYAHRDSAADGTDNTNSRLLLIQRRVSTRASRWNA